MTQFKYALRQASFIGAALLLLFAIACCSTNQPKKKKVKKSALAKKEFYIVNPTPSQVYKLNEEVNLRVHHKDNLLPDSIILYRNNSIVEIQKDKKQNYRFKAESKLVGSQNYKVNVFYSDSLKETHTFKIFLLPTEEPKNISFETVRKFDHDPEAYTQGLLYQNGYIYESTGRKKQSSIRRIDVKTGEVVRKKALDPEFFGEGIAVVGKEVYMITYISQVGFVFDAVTFDLIRKFDLQTREGWGLTTYNNELILSDGTPNLFFFDPQYFNLKKQIEICDNKGLVSKLNELEYTKYGLFANVYGAKHIVLIDVETGTVIGELNLASLFPENIPDDFEHVLNGIAYNPDSDTFYVTGKQWPVIYEIKLSID